MKKILVVVTMNVFFIAPALAERPRLDGREAPRATDLLRAERLAEQARKRLEMPAPRSSGWKHGGTGWGEPEATEPREPRDVIIDVNSPRKPRRAPQ
jgi:hypothetical protein